MKENKEGLDRYESNISGLNDREDSVSLDEPLQLSGSFEDDTRQINRQMIKSIDDQLSNDYKQLLTNIKAGINFEEVFFDEIVRAEKQEQVFNAIKSRLEVFIEKTKEGVKSSSKTALAKFKKLDEENTKTNKDQGSHQMKMETI